MFQNRIVIWMSESDESECSPRASPIRGEDVMEVVMEQEDFEEVEEELEQEEEEDNDNFKTPKTNRLPPTTPTPTVSSSSDEDKAIPDPFPYTISEIIEELLHGFVQHWDKQEAEGSQ